MKVNISLQGKIALVTGSGRGIGKAIAQTLAEQGATIIINDLMDTAEDTASEIRKVNNSCIFIKANISNSQEVNQMMDNIIDLELEKVDAILHKIDADPEEFDMKKVERNLWENIKRKAEEGRRTGIGITAEGDMLAALNLRYGTDIANEFSVEVHKTLAIEAYRASMEMAKHRGPFKIFNADREKNNPLLLRIKNEDPQLYSDILSYGRRNVALLTIAPTGSVSLLTQTTSGIEPVFLPVYRRRRKVNPNDAESNISFVDEIGDAWEEYNVCHHKFIVWAEQRGINVKDIATWSQEKLDALVKESPYYKATSNDIDWTSKVQMQGDVQKWVDHSISVTINLPENVDESLVGELYVKAWSVGCKGVTVYRDGSRTGVLISNKDKKEDGNENQETTAYIPPRRPEQLEADVVRFMNNKEEWIAFVGMYDGHPYEIFTGIVDEDTLYLPKSIKKGFIIKHKLDDDTTRYDFSFIDKQGYKATFEGLNRLFNKEYWNYARLISGVLRHRMPIESIVNLVSSLHLDNDSISSWRSGVERTLKQYIPSGTKVTSGKKCDTCGESTLQYQEGCLICTTCGTSKCG